ncbi:MAG: sugar phosphate isomerase/epimerase [Akkermansiaceae bacterium]|nr:sugar phosphate isomerase/epimerase [Akkermansiaceae bacterium]
MNSLQSRRQFVTTTALGVATLAAFRALGANGQSKIPIAVQLYSVRGDCNKDFDATLAAIAKLGIAGVEFAGYYQYAGKPKELKAKLDELGLKAAATHIGTNHFRGDNLQKTIEFHQEIGCKYLIVPGDGDFTNPAKSQALADTFNEVAAKLKPLGMACGYHNHAHEFDKVGDTNHWEIFAKRTSKDVILQIDFGWSAVAGQDGPDLVKRHPGRCQVVHLKPTVVKKEAGKKAIIGQDSVDWPAIIKACREHGDTQWLTLEQEAYPDGKSPMECVALSFAALAKMV